MAAEAVTLNNASDYGTNGHYRTPNPNPSPLVRESVSPIIRCIIICDCGRSIWRYPSLRQQQNVWSLVNDELMTSWINVVWWWWW